MFRGSGVILPPHEPLQATAPASDGGLEWIKYSASAALGFVASFVGFRTRLYGLKRDIDDREREHKALERKVDDHHSATTKLIEDSVTRLEKAIRDAKDDRQLVGLKDGNATNAALNAIRKDNEDHHKENRERLRV